MLTTPPIPKRKAAHLHAGPFDPDIIFLGACSIEIGPEHRVRVALYRLRGDAGPFAWSRPLPRPEED